ncbi:MAG: hypothetical protein VKP72_06645 [bacterium]|nr:hypothetical protein [bacterium]
MTQTSRWLTLALALGTCVPVMIGCLPPPARAATSFAPDIRWLTLESPHFRVTYPDGLEDVGRKVVAFAEDAHRQLTAYMQCEPYEKTEIVCFDTFDDTNANASNAQHNKINLNLYPPTPDGGLALGRHDDWLRFVILHEYTHILHQNLTPWALQQLNAAVGAVLLSNVQIAGIPPFVTRFIPTLLSNQPRFILEGWAVTTESLFTGGGRAREGNLDMQLRMAALDGRLLGIDQVVLSSVQDWPSGGNEYDYGMAFFRYVQATYGEDVPRKILKTYGELPWLGLDAAVSRVLPDKNGESLYEEMRVWLMRRSRTQREALLARGIVPSTRWTSGGRHHHHPTWLPDGRLAYTESVKGKGAWLATRELQLDKRSKVWLRKDALGGFSVNRDASKVLYFEQEEDRDRFTSFTDLVVWERSTGQTRKLTKSLRAADPCFSPDGKSLVALVSGKGANHLVRLDAEGQRLGDLTPLTFGTTWANPIFSPDGQHVVATRFRAGKTQLVRIAIATGALTELTDGSGMDLYPRYTPDGAWVLFTSDRHGPFNVYALRADDNTMVRLTNGVGGCFEGAVSPDGKTLAFVDYQGTGYDIHTMPFDPARGTKVDAREALEFDFQGQLVPRVLVPVEPADETLASKLEPRPYSPWPSLMPVTVTPAWGFQGPLGTTAGLSLNGQDVLRQHFYSVYGAYTFNGPAAVSGRPQGFLYYQNDQAYPSLQVQGSFFPTIGRYPVRTSTGAGLMALWSDQTRLELSTRLPGLPFPLLGSNWVDGQSFELGYTGLFNRPFALSSLSDAQTALPIPSDASGFPSVATSATTESPGLTGSVFLNYQRADNMPSTYGVSPEAGSVSSLGVELAHPALAGDLDGTNPAKPGLLGPAIPSSKATFTRLWGDHRHYLSMPWSHHVLALRAATSLNFGQNGGGFTLGGINNPIFLNQQDLTSATSLETRFLPFRGYDNVSGNHMGFLSAEYRLPLLSVQRGFGSAPLYLERLGLVVGTDLGAAWDNPLAPDGNRPFSLGKLMLGAGAELRAQVTIFGFLGTQFRLGVAQGFLRAEPWMFGDTPVAPYAPSTQTIVGFGHAF